MIAALALMLAAASASSWRAAISDDDRQRLHDWRTAWVAALAEARAHGGAPAIAADPVLYDPDAATGAGPGAGSYRCRRITLGSMGAVSEPWGRCTLVGGDVPLAFAGPDGPQRVLGALYPDSERRSILLGTTMFAGERPRTRYGYAAGRNLPAIAERIGERRWRLVFPYPRFGGTLQIVEMTPE